MNLVDAAIPKLTVFTPTYNRAYTLPLGYESLKRQACQDFVWLIIDDGSTDQTAELVSGWIAEGLVNIRYHYQDNLGMHGAHNKAYELIDTELNVCIDSDDYLAENAVAKIIDFWAAHGSDRVAGIVALDADPQGSIIGTVMPSELRETRLTDLYVKYRVKGDKKLVYRSALTRASPAYPIFPGEKYGPLAYKYILIEQEYPLLVMNEVLCHVEYRPDGSSMNMIHQYKRNPRGFAFFRKTAMVYAPTYRKRLREAIHYVSSSLMIRNMKFWWESPCKWTTSLAFPGGVLLYLYIRFTSRAALLPKQARSIANGRN